MSWVWQSLSQREKWRLGDCQAVRQSCDWPPAAPALVGQAGGEPASSDLLSGAGGGRTGGLLVELMVARPSFPRTL